MGARDEPNLFAKIAHGQSRWLPRTWPHASPLTRFLHVAALPPANNRSENALRRIALGRKNYRFVGNEDAGKNVASLYSLVASCELNGIHPTDYLTDVLSKSSDEADVDALLPDRWQPSLDG